MNWTGEVNDRGELVENFNNNVNNVTINDVARLAGVSKRTVSRVINGSEKVGEKTRQLILNIIKEVNYTPNTQARALASRRSYLLGMIYDTPTLFINDAQSGVLSICCELGYELVVHPCDISNPKLLAEVRQFVQRSKIDGVIVLPPVSQVDELARMLAEIGCHYVRFTSDETVDKPASLVVTDYSRVVADLARHLIDFGHRRMGFITGPKGNVSSQKRFNAFEKALNDAGIKLPGGLIAQGEFTYESGLEAARKLLTLKNPPTAIFAANDEMAVGVLNAAHKLGIKVPDQLSVVGFDGTWLASHFIPALTTVRRPVREMAVLATRKLIALINNESNVDLEQQLFVTPVFIPRDSTGPCPDS